MLSAGLLKSQVIHKGATEKPVKGSAFVQSLYSTAGLQLVFGYEALENHALDVVLSPTADMLPLWNATA
jgi:hypothetical protein